MRTLRFLLRKEFLQIGRDHAMLRLLIAMPIIQLLILSSAATFEIRGSDLYVIDRDGTSTSRGLVERLVGSGRFRVADASFSTEEADAALLDRRVTTILHIPDDFERDLVRGGVAPVQLIFNAEDGAAAAVLRSYAYRIIARYSEELGAEIGYRRTAGMGAEGSLAMAFAGEDPGAGPRPVSAAPAPLAHTSRIGGIALRTRGWYNPSLDYVDYMVPGILVVLITIVGTTVGAMNIVREKEIGTLEQLNVTPITREQFIASKLIPFWLIALGELAFGLIAGWLVFDIPFRGSLLLVFLGAATYLLAALGIGLWLSTVAETQQQAMFLAFAINMVYLLMSGLFTPVGSMPEWAQWVAELSPVKHFIVVMRAVLVKGAGLQDIAAPLAILALYGGIVLVLAVRRYSKVTA